MINQFSLKEQNKKLKSQSQKTLAYTKKKIGEILGSNFIIHTNFIDKLKKKSLLGDICGSFIIYVVYFWIFIIQNFT